MCAFLEDILRRVYCWQKRQFKVVDQGAKVLRTMPAWDRQGHNREIHRVAESRFQALTRGSKFSLMAETSDKFYCANSTIFLPC